MERKRRSDWKGEEHRRQYAAAWREQNRVKMRAYVKAYADKLRSDLLNLMGNECVRCSFNDPRALQVDHVYGGGTYDRKVQQNSSRRAFNKKVEEFKRGELQLLCANCNWIKRAENDETRKKDAA